MLGPVRRKEAQVLFGIALLYLILWLIVPKPSFWGLDNGFKFQGIRAFAETGHIKIPYYGADFDPGGGFKPMVFPFGVLDGESQVPVFSFLFMVLGSLFYRIFGGWGPFLIPLLGGWISLLAGWLMWVRFRREGDGRLFLFMFGLCSPLLFYSISLWEHSLSIALVTFSFALLIPDQAKAALIRDRKGEESNAWEVTVAGSLLALATAFRTESVFWVAIPIFFWRATGRPLQDIGRYLIGLTAGLVVVLLLNRWETGTLIPLHVMSNIEHYHYSNYEQLLNTRLYNLYVIIIQGFNDKFKSLFLLIPLIIAAAWRGWRYEKDWGYYLAIGILGVWIGYFYSLITASDRASHTINSGGLLWIVPFAVLALVPIKSKRLGRFWWFIWLCPLIYFLMVSAFTPTVRGVHWGPRFILGALPLLLIVASVRVERWWRRYNVTKPVIIVLAVISLVNQFYSYDVLLKTRRDNAALNRWAAQAGSDPTLTNMWWLPGDVSLCSDQSPWFITDSERRVKFVVGGLREKGEGYFKYIERPPYIEEDFWWSVGAEPKGKDYFLEGDGKLRRSRFRIVR